MNLPWFKHSRNKPLSLHKLSLFFIPEPTGPLFLCYNRQKAVLLKVFLGLLCNCQVSTVLCDSLVSKELRENEEVGEEKEWEAGQNGWTNDPYWIDSKM